LVGDSGERDPEIYCRAARRFPEQVQGIYIRDVVAKRMTLKRWEKLNENLPSGLCQTFEDARELGHLSELHLRADSGLDSNSNRSLPPSTESN